MKQRARCHTYTREREKEREREREREQMGESHDDKHDDIDNDNGNEDNKDDDDDNDKGKMFKLVYQFVALTRVCSRSHRRAWSRSRGSNDPVDRPHGSRPSTQRRVDDDNNDSRSLSPPRGETRYSTRLSRQSLRAAIRERHARRENVQLRNTRSGRVGAEVGEEQRTRPPAVDWRKRPARWSVANWLGLTPRVATARLDAQRPRRQRRQRRAVSPIVAPRMRD